MVDRCFDRGARLRTRSAIALGLALAALASACASTAPAGARPATQAAALPTDIWVEGDSLTVESGKLMKSLAAPSIVRIDAKTGRHVWEGLASLRVQRWLPSAVVVALGSNDDWDSYGIAAFRTNVRAIMNLLGSRRCVVWVDLYQRRTPAMIKKRQPMIFNGLNRVLYDLAASSPNVRIVRWALLSEQHSSWWAYDPLHPTDAGYRARARVTLAALRTCKVPRQGGSGSQVGGGVGPS